ncbi:Uncharacterised protein [Bordetella pertussis]|nr:Uncharacterised protein [Bordetella pertussis]
MSDIAHRETQSRFETTVDGQRCELDYVLRDHIMTIVHTGVPVYLKRHPEYQDLQA